MQFSFLRLWFRIILIILLTAANNLVWEIESYDVPQRDYSSAVTQRKHSSTVQQIEYSTTVPQKNKTRQDRPKRSNSERPCTFVISEINTNNPGADTKQFIELEQFCNSKRKIKNTLDGYKLIVIRGNPLAIVIVINLGKLIATSVEDKYIVVGSPLVEASIDINLKTSQVESIYNNENYNVLPRGDESPYGLALLYNKSPLIMREIKLYRNTDGSFAEFNLADDNLIQTYIYNNIKDFVVYGRKVATKGCMFFDWLWPADSTPSVENRYLLRDWESNNPNDADYTLNRCTSELTGFRPESFKYGLPSPKKPNNCGGRGFFTEDVIDEVSPFRPLEEESDSNLGMCEPPFKRLKVDRYRDISTEKFQDLIQKAALSNTTCNVKQDSSYSFAATHLDITITNSLIKRSGGVEIVPLYKQHVFNSMWKENCLNYLPKNASILDNVDVQSWLDVEVLNDGCRFSCYSCKLYFLHSFRKDIKTKSDIQTPNGYFHSCKYENQRKIKEHLKNEVHFEATKFMYDVSKASTTDQYNAVLKNAEEAENKIYLPTVRLITFVYAEILSDVSFKKHPIFMKTLKTLGLDVGIHHQHANAANNIMSVISESFHKILLNHLVLQPKPFSLIIDTTTDNRNLPLLIVYLQTLEEGQPIVYFHSLIHLENGESAQETFKSFEKQLQKDEKIQQGFIEYFRSNLISLSSDGASVNVGSENSFHTITNKYLGRKIPLVRCLAHKLQLTINRAISKKNDTVFSGYFKKFEKTSNEFYVFYMSRGSKRWGHLVDVGSNLGIKPKRMKRFLEVRWASSEYEIMKSLVYDYDVLKNDLLEMNADTNFAPTARTTALSLYSLLEDKTYSLVLREMLDLLEIYKGMSLKLQESAGILVDKSEIVEKGIKEFFTLKQQTGVHVNAFLGNCSCPGVCEEKTCTLKQFDDCKEIYFNNFVLTKADNNSIPMSEYRSILYEVIIREMYYYFDIDLLNSFEIFNPRKIQLPKCNFVSETVAPEIADATACIPNEEQKDFVGYSVPKNKLDKVCSFYFIPENICNQFGNEWEKVIDGISQHQLLVQNFDNEDASSFWPLALTFPEIPWTNLTIKFVELILTTAMSSSECERGFSYVTRLKSNERSSLSTGVLENIVRIKVNGPRNIENFNGFKYARNFLAKHARSDDKSANGGRPSNPDKLKSKFKESRLF